MPTIVHKLVGRVSYRVLPRLDNGTIPIDVSDAWEAENILRVYIPQLAGVDDGSSAGCSGKIRLHKRAAPQFIAAFAEIEKAGLKRQILTFAGSYYPRMMRGAKLTPSEHTWGTAIDINVAWNGLNKHPASLGKKGSVRELVPIFARHGIIWGGNWKRKDGMHFQVDQWLNVPVVAPKPQVIAATPFWTINGEKIETAFIHGERLCAPVIDTLKTYGLETHAPKVTARGGDVKAWPKG